MIALTGGEMFGIFFRRPALLACALLLFGVPVAAEVTNDIDEARISEIVVTSQRRPQPRFEHAGNIALLDAEALTECFDSCVSDYGH